MDSIDRCVEENTALFDRTCATAKAGGAELVIFPEMALTGYNIGAERIRALAEPRSGAMIPRLTRRRPASSHWRALWFS